MPSLVARALGVSLVPLVAVWELAALRSQHAHVPRDDDWRAAASAAVAARSSGDVILVAPRWAEGHGREAINPRPVDGAPIDPSFDERTAARIDLDEYTRALELSIRGKDDPQTKGWRLLSEQRFGDVALRTLQNPSPQPLVRDLVDAIGPDANVYRATPDADGVTSTRRDPCRWESGQSATHLPNLFQGPEPPPSRWVCPPFDPNWTFVAPTVITDLDYVPRRCLLMHPLEPPMRTTIELPAGPIGSRFVGYVGLHVFVEREQIHSPVIARVTVGTKIVAETKHVDGEGWKRFEGSTEGMTGEQPVKIELWADGPARLRLACFAGQLRK